MESLYFGSSSNITDVYVLPAQRTSPVGPVKRQLEERSEEVVSKQFGCSSYVEFCCYHNGVGSELGQLTSFSRAPSNRHVRTDNIAHGLQLLEIVAIKLPEFTSVISEFDETISVLDVHDLEQT